MVKGEKGENMKQSTIAIGYTGSFADQACRTIDEFRLELARRINMPIGLVFYHSNMGEAARKKGFIVDDIETYLDSPQKKVILNLSLFLTPQVQFPNNSIITPPISSWENMSWLCNVLENIYDFQKETIVVSHNPCDENLCLQKFVEKMLTLHPKIRWAVLREELKVTKEIQQIIPLFLCPGRHLTEDFLKQVLDSGAVTLSQEKGSLMENDYFGKSLLQFLIEKIGQQIKGNINDKDKITCDW